VAIGVIALAVATAVVADYPKPIKAALAQRKVAKWGLIIGNPILAGINTLCVAYS